MRWLTLPNLLSTSRLLLAPLCAALLMQGAPQWAACVFYLAVASDVLDGRIARARHQVTALGGMLDHASDAAFVAMLLTTLAWQGVVPILLPPLVAVAFAQYMLDSKALAGQALRASWLGRRNGVLYFALVGTSVTRDALLLSWPPDRWITAFGWLLVASTLLSMLDRALALLHVQRGRHE